MFERPDNITLVIPADGEAKENSVRRSLRWMWRDFCFLWRALRRHCRSFQRIYGRGWQYTNHWWL